MHNNDAIHLPTAWGQYASRDVADLCGSSTASDFYSSWMSYSRLTIRVKCFKISDMTSRCLKQKCKLTLMVICITFS